MLESRRYKCVNLKPQTYDKFEAILNYLKPKSTSLDLLDYIIDNFIESQKIPISELIKEKEIPA